MIPSSTLADIYNRREAGERFIDIASELGLSPNAVMKRYRTFVANGCKCRDRRKQNKPPREYRQHFCTVCGSGGANPLTGLCRWCANPPDPNAHVEPTTTRLGTPERVQVYVERVRAGLPLFVPGDRNEW